MCVSVCVCVCTSINTQTIQFRLASPFSHVHACTHSHTHTVTHTLTHTHIAQAIQSKLAALVDSMKTETGDVDVVVVGGGAPLAAQKLPGARLVVVPPKHAAVANAVGAAIPQVGKAF